MTKTVIIGGRPRVEDGKVLTEDGRPIEEGGKPIIDGGKRVVLREMTAIESLTADDYVGGSLSQNRAYKVYAVCSVAKIDDEPMTPLDTEGAFLDTLRRFSLAELGELVKEYTLFFGEVVKASDPKGSPAVPQ